MKPLLVVAVLCSVQIAFAQNESVLPLEVGDVFPLTEIKSKIHGRDSVFRLGSGKEDELVILEFMNTNCGICYYPLPLVDSLVSADDRLKFFLIMPDSDSVTFGKISKKILGGRETRVPVVFSDTTLRCYFPYDLVSHVVWMNGKGRVLAITGSEYLTLPYITEAFEKRSLNWPVKKDVIGFDHQIPWLVWHPSLPQTTGKIYYSAFSEEMPGISPPNGFSTDVALSILRFSFYNNDLKTVCQMAADFSGRYKPEMFEFGQGVSERLNEQSGNSATKFCYDAVFPLGINRNQAKEIIKADLKKWLTVYGITITTNLDSNTAKPKFRIELIH